MRYDVDKRPPDNGPGGRLVEGDVLVERNVVVEGRLADEGNEVAADRQQDEDHIDVENERSGTSNSCRQTTLDRYMTVSDLTRTECDAKRSTRGD